MSQNETKLPGTMTHRLVNTTPKHWWDTMLNFGNLIFWSTRYGLLGLPAAFPEGINSLITNMVSNSTDSVIRTVLKIGFGYVVGGLIGY